mmetsp:Transcript_65456/g.206864  ORF Transcript_65456/g.206864 Transcript_65456/m.206864 type:complete len:271 (-) Transcript_65456:686-1498(-)
MVTSLSMRSWRQRMCNAHELGFRVWGAAHPSMVVCLSTKPWRQRMCMRRMWFHTTSSGAMSEMLRSSPSTRGTQSRQYVVPCPDTTGSRNTSLHCGQMTRPSGLPTNTVGAPNALEKKVFFRGPLASAAESMPTWRAPGPSSGSSSTRLRPSTTTTPAPESWMTPVPLCSLCSATLACSSTSLSLVPTAWSSILDRVALLSMATPTWPSALTMRSACTSAPGAAMRAYSPSTLPLPRVRTTTGGLSSTIDSTSTSPSSTMYMVSTGSSLW